MGQRKQPKDIQDSQQLQVRPPKAQDQRLMSSKEHLYVTLLDTEEFLLEATEFLMECMEEFLLEDMELLMECMEESRQAFTLEQLEPLGTEPLPRWEQLRRRRRHGEPRVLGRPL